MPEGIDECFLHEIEARLFIARQFEDVDIQWQPVTTEERLPSLGVAGPCFGHGQMFAFSHYQRLPNRVPGARKGLSA
jgi:hypothetical protein